METLNFEQWYQQQEGRPDYTLRYAGWYADATGEDFKGPMFTLLDDMGIVVQKIAIMGNKIRRVSSG